MGRRGAVIIWLDTVLIFKTWLSETVTLDKIKTVLMQVVSI